MPPSSTAQANTDPLDVVGFEGHLRAAADGDPRAQLIGLTELYRPPE